MDPETSAASRTAGQSTTSAGTTIFSANTFQRTVKQGFDANADDRPQGRSRVLRSHRRRADGHGP